MMSKTIAAQLLVVMILFGLPTINGLCPAAGTGAVYPTTKADSIDISFYQPSQQTAPYPHDGNGKPRNIILFIGDGMGPAQIALARLSATAQQGRLYIERLPVTGLVYTHSADCAVTDSAAAGTALACGIKTNNGMLGIRPAGTNQVSILEAAGMKGFRTGLVVTSTITHATPASFAAHVKSRSSEAQIAEQLLAGRVDVMLGGGRQYFLPTSVTGGVRDEGRNLLIEAADAGYAVISDRQQLFNVQVGPVLGLFQDDGMTTLPPEPSLEEMTVSAIRLLTKKSTEWFAPEPKFFLMVEGSQIDWACHANEANNCIRQVLLMDQAVKTAMDFATKDKKTLVLVTSDHETGGLALTENAKKPWVIKPVWAGKSHSALPVSIYAYGPGAGEFTGTMDNTHIPVKIAALLGIKPFPRAAEKKETARTAPAVMSDK